MLTKSEPIAPEVDNETRLFQSLAGLLSKKGNTPESLEYDMIREWFDEEQMGENGLKNRYQREPKLTSLNKILFKINILPASVIEHYIREYMPVEEQNDWIDYLIKQQKSLLENSNKQSVYVLFSKTPAAQKIEKKITSTH